jgi:hypothetical protein
MHFLTLALCSVYFFVPLSETFETKRNNPSCFGRPAVRAPSEYLLEQYEAGLCRTQNFAYTWDFAHSTIPVSNLAVWSCF